MEGETAEKKEVLDPLGDRSSKEPPGSSFADGVCAAVCPQKKEKVK